MQLFSGKLGLEPRSPAGQADPKYGEGYFLLKITLEFRQNDLAT